MRKINIKATDQLLYSTLFYIDEGVRGTITVHAAKKDNINWGDFYLTDAGAFHLNRTYEYFDNAAYTMGFIELQRVLYQIAVEEGVFLTTDYLAREFAEVRLSEHIQTEIIILNNMESLALLFEHMMRYNYSPALTSDFLDKLEFTQADDGFEASAFILAENIRGIIGSTNFTEMRKQDVLELFIKDNVQIFKDYEQSKKEE